MTKSVEKYEQIFDFWSEADEIKQRGFYIDYKGQLLSPSDLDVEFYKNCNIATIQFREDCKSFIEFFKTLDRNEIDAIIEMVNKDQGFEKFVSDIFSRQLK